LPPPERTILVQMEQVKVSQWMTPHYLDTLNASLAVLDYSLNNISALVDLGLPVRQLYYLPILPYAMPHRKDTVRDIDVLFYGAASSPRRRAYLEVLSRRFNLRIETDLFGDDLRRLLDRTKVVVN